MDLDMEQEELYDAWSTLRDHVQEIISRYNVDKKQLEEITAAFSDKWDAIKEEEQAWNALLALMEQKRNNVYANIKGLEAPFPLMNASSENLIKAADDYISGVRPLKIDLGNEEEGEPIEEVVSTEEPAPAEEEE